MIDKKAEGKKILLNSKNFNPESRIFRGKVAFNTINHLIDINYLMDQFPLYLAHIHF